MSCVVEIGKRRVLITGPEARRVAESYKLQEYLTDCDEQLVINEIEVIWSKSKGNGDLLFALIRVHTSLPNGEQVKANLVILSGHATSVLNVYIDEFGDEWGLTVVQPRLALGSFEFEELPAGMDDGDDPANVAIREVEEETTQSIDRMSLIHLGTTVPSAGLKAEKVSLFAVVHQLSRAKILALNGIRAGLASEGEYIHTKISPLDEILKRTLDAKAQLSILLYMNLKK
jgi:hypothetical protein